LSDRENLIISFQPEIFFQLAERVGVWGRVNDRVRFAAKKDRLPPERQDIEIRAVATIRPLYDGQAVAHTARLSIAGKI